MKDLNLTGDYDLLQKENSDLKSANKHLVLNCMELSTDMEDLEEEIARLKEKNAYLKKEIEELECDLCVEYENQNMDLERLNKKIEELEIRNKILEEDNRDLEELLMETRDDFEVALQREKLIVNALIGL